MLFKKTYFKFDFHLIDKNIQVNKFAVLLIYINIVKQKNYENFFGFAFLNNFIPVIKNLE